MITIQIRNGQGQGIGMVNDFFTLSVQDEVNKGGSLKLRIPLADWIRTTPLKKGYRISVNYGISIKKNLMLFDGYIADFVLKSESVEIEAYNWLHYLQYRLIKQKKTYNSIAIKTIVAEIFEQINQSGQLPFLL